ncbi:MAG: hypothetical protein Q3983_10205 [Capnocytophaga sp.]|jgi:hypothetical protein|nr:hypothetical protein [Capnocytophaga sp.]
MAKSLLRRNNMKIYATIEELNYPFITLLTEFGEKELEITHLPETSTFWNILTVAFEEENTVFFDTESEEILLLDDTNELFNPEIEEELIVEEGTDLKQLVNTMQEDEIYVVELNFLKGVTFDGK